jgi:uncharacterized protein YgbK (DUF1537 family)
MAMRVLIVADDLTGALDSAVALTGAGLRCVVARRPGDVAAALALRPDVLGISTASREGSVAAARAAVAAALDAVGELPEIVFKKVDSRLKGHVAAEVAVLAERAGRRCALVAPAIPGQGRIVADGRLSGTGVAAPIDVAAALAASGLDLDVPATRGDGDLDRPLARALAGRPALLVGAAGLAAALARKLAPGEWAIPVPRLEAPILLAVGSHDPITIAQIDRLAGTGKAAIAAAPEGACPALIPGAAGVMRLVAVEGRVFDARAAGARFAGGIGKLVREGDVRTLLGCGGETADAILGELGAGALVIEGEVLPGVPASSILLGDRRLKVVTKSGGFGGEDALVAVVAAATDPREGAS